ncbi:MAG: PQQ-binding-like beta-propeller repeat protein [Candidatus Micrarchaeota archaeon]|nr:PQQ-binding-like beta-propeller repeat protein [Candidatus Micrarchaeota archaeon]
MSGRQRTQLIVIFISLLAFFLAVFLLLPSPSRHTPISTPAFVGVGQGAQQYAGGPTHVYFLNETISPLNISLGDAIIGTPTLYNGILLVSTMGNLTQLVQSRYDLTRGGLTAIQEGTGAVLWRDTFQNQIMSQPITAGNVIIIAMGNNQEVPPQYYNLNNAVFGIDFSTGRVLWRVNTTGSAMATPPLYSGNVIAVTMLGMYYLINATNGTVEASGSFGKPDLLSSPVLQNGTVYFGGSSALVLSNGTWENFGGFFAMNALTGNILWETDEPNASTGFNDECAVIYNGNVISAYLAYSAYNNPTLVSFNRTTGRILWELNETRAAQNMQISGNPPMGVLFNYTQNAVSPLLLYNGVVYSDSNFVGILFAVNASTGKPIWAFNTGQEEGAPNIIGGKYIIDISDSGVLNVLNITNGNLVKQIQIGMPHLTSQVLVTDNYALISTMTGRLETIPINELIGG